MNPELKLPFANKAGYKAYIKKIKEKKAALKESIKQNKLEIKNLHRKHLSARFYYEELKDLCIQFTQWCQLHKAAKQEASRLYKISQKTFLIKPKILFIEQAIYQKVA